MNNTKTSKELFDSRDFSNPVDKNKATATGSMKKQRRIKEKKPTPESIQPFLPGLSRRGRPRSQNPVPATVRARESRKRRLSAGMKRIELLLPPEIAADLQRLSLHYRIPRVEIISRLIAKAAKRIPAA